MSVLRNTSDFSRLWDRRTTVTLEDGIAIDMVSHPDLVAIKKNHRDKDWSHIRRLIEGHYMKDRDNCSAENVRFWLAEALTPEILRSLAAGYPGFAPEVAHRRSVLQGL